MASTNQELSKLFAEMAAVLELTGANSFRVSAHANVARKLKDLTQDVRALSDDISQLTALDGIGKGSAEKIIEFCQTGAVAEHQELLEQVPAGLIALLDIQGLGPKSVKLMWEKAGVVDMDTLKQKLDAGEIEKLPRMGKKTVENIRDALQFAAASSKRIRLGQALPIATEMISTLEKTPGVQQMAYAGSLRRGRETIGDIDILASSDNPEALAEAFRSQDGVNKVLAAGETKSSIRMESGLQVDLRIVPDDVFGAALMYFTGSKQHNVVLRERAIKMDMRLNEYGLFPGAADDDRPPQQRGVTPHASRTEQEIYEMLRLPCIPPELREDRGEIDAELPSLINLEDIRAELHAHTTASDGKLTIEELAIEAKARGFHTIAVTDHSKSSVQANGLSVDRLKAHIDAIREANEGVNGITILAGSEVDILADGRLDYDDDVLAMLDVVVASPHIALKQDSTKATARLLKAIEHPLVHIIGHPTGRVINKREGLDPDIHTLIAAAVEHDTALEINANFLRLDLRDVHVRAAVDAGAKIAINTDAHSREHFDFLQYGVTTGRRGWLTAESCINTWTKQKLHKWLRSKR